MIEGSKAKSKLLDYVFDVPKVKTPGCLSRALIFRLASRFFCYR